MRTYLAMAAALVAAPALAQDMDISTMDTDGDGMVSMEEMTTAYPDMTEESFTQADANGDGMLDEAEMTAAVEAGTITPTEG